MKYQIEFDVSNEAKNINFGALLSGNGKAWFDGSVQCAPLLLSAEATAELGGQGVARRFYQFAYDGVDDDAGHRPGQSRQGLDEPALVGILVAVVRRVGDGHEGRPHQVGILIGEFLVHARAAGWRSQIRRGRWLEIEYG